MGVWDMFRSANSHSVPYRLKWKKYTEFTAWGDEISAGTEVKDSV